MKIRSLLLSIILTMALLGTVSAALADRVIASPTAPNNTITIDTCTEANFDNALAAANSGDVIDVRCATSSPSAPQTIVFSTQKIISKSLTLVGTHSVTGVNRLSGGDATRLFVVNNGKTLILSNITLEHGYSTNSGGCLQVYGTLVALTTTLQHCRTFNLLIAPGGGAVYANTANVLLTNTTFYSNTADGSGGGLYAYNTAVSSNRSRFDSNLAYDQGGGLYQRLGKATFKATTLTSNTARYRGGGLSVTEVPTFYLQADSHVEFNHTTDLTDGVGGGAYFTASHPYIDNAFFIQNSAQQYGGGIAAENSSLILYNSVISGNVAQDGPAGGVLFFSTDGGSVYNTLFQNNRSQTVGGGLANAGQLNLDSSQFRGNFSHQGGGLFNSRSGDLQISHTLFDENRADAGGGFKAEGLVRSGTWLTFTKNIAQTGGGGLCACTLLSESSHITLTHVWFSNNLALIGYGGGIAASDNVTLSLSDAHLVGNQVRTDGAGLWARGAFVHLDDSFVTDNKVDGADDYSSGGGLYITGTSQLTLHNVQVERNQIDVRGNGGGMHIYGGTANLSNVTLNDNQGQGIILGGGLYLENITATINGLTATGNQGVASGGGIELLKAEMNLANAHLQHNDADSTGGGIDAHHSTVTLNNVTISAHDTIFHGAGIECLDCQGTWQNVTVDHNTAYADGGGLTTYLSDLTIQNSTFEANTAQDGGGIYNSGGTLQLVNVTLSSNHAITTGGGIYNYGAAITLTNATLKDNSAVQGGGFFNRDQVDTHTYLKNTVLADSPSGGNCNGKAFDGSKYSLSSDLTCALSGTGDQNNIAAQLNPLSNVGGATKVHLPLPDSPLINMVIGSDYPPTDQRGLPRPQGPGADVGAVERQPGDPTYGLLVYLPLLSK